MRPLSQERAMQIISMAKGDRRQSADVDIQQFDGETISGRAREDDWYDFRLKLEDHLGRAALMRWVRSEDQTLIDAPAYDQVEYHDDLECDDDYDEDEMDWDDEDEDDCEPAPLHVREDVDNERPLIDMVFRDPTPVTEEEKRDDETCVCGDPVNQHTYGHGHTPVSSFAYLNQKDGK